MASSPGFASIASRSVARPARSGRPDSTVKPTEVAEPVAGHDGGRVDQGDYEQVGFSAWSEEAILKAAGRDDPARSAASDDPVGVLAEPPASDGAGRLDWSQLDPDARSPVSQVAQVAPDAPTDTLAAPSRESFQADVGLRRLGRKAAVVAKLAAAVSFRPGSQADGAQKALALREMLATLDEVGRVLAPLGLDEPSKVELLSGLAEVIARGWHADGPGAVDVAHAVSDVLGELDLVDGDACAEPSWEVSLRLACWHLFGAVRDERIGGQMATFSYSLEASEIVSHLMAGTVAIVRDTKGGKSDALMGVALRSVATLVGAEYVSRTRISVNWLDQSDGPVQRQERLAQLESDFVTRTVPAIVACARGVFLAVEQIADKALASCLSSSGGDDDGQGSN